MNLFSSLFWTHCLLIHYFASVFTHEFIQLFFNVANESKIKLIKCDLLGLLSDQVWWCNRKQFFQKLHQQIYASQLWHYINYSTFIYCSFKSGKCGKEEKKLQKCQYLKNEKSFLDEIKNIFHSFWRAIIYW